MNELKSEFYTAIKTGDIESVRLLLQRCEIDPSADENAAICDAVKLGHIDIVELLLSEPVAFRQRQYDFNQVDPAAIENYSLIWAAVYGHANIVHNKYQ